jgi:hypothetical protein
LQRCSFSFAGQRGRSARSRAFPMLVLQYFATPWFPLLELMIPR